MNYIRSYDISEKSDGLGRYDSYVGNGLFNYDVVCYAGSNGIPQSTIQGVTKDADMPNNLTTNGIKNPYDDGTFYNGSENSYYLPSPYQNDGSYNPIYSQTTSPSSENNAMSDFKGIVNTKIITDLANGQSDWKTASGISNFSDTGYYPAACCCARFKTTGTKAFVDCSTDELRNGTGFWYLPAMGELGYIMPRLKQIKQTMSILNEIYTIWGTHFINENSNSSSTECSKTHIYTMNYSSFKVRNTEKYQSSSAVRAFMRLQLNSSSQQTH